LDLRKKPEPKPWVAFAASYSVQAVALLALLAYTVVAPKIEPAPTKFVDLMAPDLNPAPKVHAKPVRQAARIEPPHIIVRAVAPRIQAPVMQLRQPERVRPVVQVAEVPQPQVAPVKFDSKVLNTLPAPKAPKIIATNTFGGNSPAPTLQKIAPAKVQTGGFGDPNGVPTNVHGSARSNIATVGSFDLPAGGGHGNGSSGASGARGTVASVGFGNTIAVQGSGRTGRIQTTTFGNATAAPIADAPRQGKVTASSTPVSIQSKPNPVYSAEARQLRVEGEVLLNVVFTANGQIHVLKVVRGLGHGLDEDALRAAQGVKFTPATRDGHPVDSTATLHIVFQLS
jgi:TonB family protein